MPQLSPWTQRAFDVLADGSWHEEDAVLREMMKTIPPGQAIRHAEKRRVAQNPATNSPPAQRAVPRSPEYLRVLGGRAIALAALKNTVKLERKTDENGRWVRIRPDVLGRHLLVQQRVDRPWPQFPSS